jgi:2-oxoglutarate ferredoxin oxidoreductase subunit alpha
MYAGDGFIDQPSGPWRTFLKTNRLIIRFSGEQGQGVQSVASITGQFFSGQGYQVLAVNDYASRIKGGYSYSQILVSTTPARSVDRGADLAFAISPKLLAKDLKTMGQRGRLFAEAGKVPDELQGSFLPVPLETELAPEQRRGVNMFFVGMTLALTGQPLAPLEALLARRFAKQGEAVIAANMAIAVKGHAYASASGQPVVQLDTPTLPAPAVVKTGSQAVALGAVAAGVKFHAGYPMAPSTAVMNTLAGLSRKRGILVEQAEDEIAAINLAIGASYAGVRAMTATSGGGLALMGEAVSMVAISETPLVIVNVQRPGPATGLPTKTAQGDLHMVQYIGHGEFSRVILAPGNASQAFLAGQKAHYLAEKYQIPVFVLLDQLLGDSLWSSPEWKVVPEYQKRFIKMASSLQEPTPYPRYSLASGCISPRAIPGLTHDLVLADSHTHDEFGHITEDPDLSAAMVDKLMAKKGLLETELAPPERFGDEDAKTLLVTWGSCWGVVRDVCELLAGEGVSIGHVHFHDVYPVAEEAVKKAFGQARLITVETNATGQFARLLRGEYGITVDDQILKYNGRPFYTDELTAELRGRLSP